ncbi:MAG: hypothetical protein JWN10_832 [Solirubrobacterales bacterium]|nr:hypothetical protein [Solirubrobacterales bacterium]
MPPLTAMWPRENVPAHVRRKSVDRFAVTRSRLKLLLGVGVVLGAAAVAITLTQAPITVARVNMAEETFVSEAHGKLSACQTGETLPRGTSAIRLRTYAFLGPRAVVEVRAQGRTIAHGERGSGWTGGVVTIPVNRLRATRSGVELCFTLFGNGDESVEVMGEPTSGLPAASVQAGSLPGRIRVEYLRPGAASWWSIAPEVARHMGLGHAAAGTWSVLLVIVLMSGIVALCSRLILRELG